MVQKYILGNLKARCKKPMFEPFRCESCAYGVYEKDCAEWLCMKNVEDKDDCEEKYLEI